MQLFYVKDIDPSCQSVTLSKEESNHVIGVLRRKVGDQIHIIDGRGNLYSGTIAVADMKKCGVAICDCQKEYGRLPYSLHIAMAPTKSIDRYEWFLEKATEIGVDQFTSIESFNSERRVVKDERLDRVILSAVKQSIKSYLPRNNPMTRFEKFVVQDFGVARKFIAHCNPSEDKRLLKDIITPTEDCVIMIGPEGDFSPQEVELAQKNGFVEISLGENRLRSETAGVFAVAVVAMVNQK